VERIRDAGARVLVALSSFRNEVEAIADAAGLECVILTHFKTFMPLKRKVLYTLLEEQAAEMKSGDMERAGGSATIHSFTGLLARGMRFSPSMGPGAGSKCGARGG